LLAAFRERAHGTEYDVVVPETAVTDFPLFQIGVPDENPTAM
jgi:hypothetical protein